MNLPVLQSEAVAQWRHRNKQDWVGHTVLAFSEILNRAEIPHLWIGDVALQELGLEYLAPQLDLLTNRGTIAVLALKGVASVTPGRIRTNVLTTHRHGALVRVWDSTDPRHVRNLRKFNPNTGLRIASLKECLIEQQIMCERNPSLEMEHRVQALKSLARLRG